MASNKGFIGVPYKKIILKKYGLGSLKGRVHMDDLTTMFDVGVHGRIEQAQYLTMNEWKSKLYICDLP